MQTLTSAGKAYCPQLLQLSKERKKNRQKQNVKKIPKNSTYDPNKIIIKLNNVGHLFY